MTEQSWVEEFPGSITVCDREGVILEMNARSAETFQEDGGKELIGSNLLNCHPELARRQARKDDGDAAGQCVYHRKEGVKSWFTKRPGTRWPVHGLCRADRSRFLSRCRILFAAAEAWHKAK